MAIHQKARKVTLAFLTGEQTLSAIVSGPLAVHRSVNCGARRWSVTHIGSAGLVFDGLRTRAEALRRMRTLHRRWPNARSIASR